MNESSTNPEIEAALRGDLQRLKGNYGEDVVDQLAALDGRDQLPAPSARRTFRSVEEMREYLNRPEHRYIQRAEVNGRLLTVAWDGELDRYTLDIADSTLEEWRAKGGKTGGVAVRTASFPRDPEQARQAFEQAIAAAQHEGDTAALFERIEAQSRAFLDSQEGHASSELEAPHPGADRPSAPSHEAGPISPSPASTTTEVDPHRYS